MPIHSVLQKIRTVNPYPGFRGVVPREWRRLRADGPQKILLVVIAPLVFWLFCAFLGDGTVKNLPVAICDDDHSALSRTIARSIDATKLMHVLSYVKTVEELQQGIAAGRYAAGLYLPANMEADVKAGRQVQPVLFRNGTNFLVSSFIARDAQTVLRTVNAGLIKSRLAKVGLGAGQAMALVSPIAVDMSNLYNPSFNYCNYLAPGIVFAQLGMIVMLSGAICFARERERNTLAQLRHRARARIGLALHGKAAPYALAIALLTAGILLVLFPVYNIARFGDGVAALPGIALFLCASWWMGALAGIVTGRVLVAAQVAIFLGMPSFIFSGWTFPLPAAPEPMAAAAQVLPFTHFMPVWFSAARMHLGPFSPVKELAILVSITVFSYAATRFVLAYAWNRPLCRTSASATVRSEVSAAEGEAQHA